MSMTPDQRYHRDVEFHALVDLIDQMIITCNYTPTELHKAVMLASINYDLKNPRPILLTMEQAHHFRILLQE